MEENYETTGTMDKLKIYYRWLEYAIIGSIKRITVEIIIVNELSVYIRSKGWYDSRNAVYY